MSGSKRKWECKRCQEPINIHLPDADKKYVIDGSNLFCSRTCCSYFKQYIPVDPSLKRVKEVKKVQRNKAKKEAQFKCFNCGNITGYMTWDKLCGVCNTSNLSPAEKSLIKLIKL